MPPQPPSANIPGLPDPASIPVTDAKVAPVRDGLPTIRVAEKAAERRDANLARARAGEPAVSPLAWPAAEQVMQVAPAPGRTVLDINGEPYPPEGVSVPVADVYAHRRLRDGSLMRIP